MTTNQLDRTPTTYAGAPAGSLRLNSMEPWWICRSQPNAEELAKLWLERNGFEVWYPRGKHVTAIPQNKLPSKTRHRRRYEFREKLRPAYPGYLLVRRLWGDYDVHRLYDLPHVGGLCMFGEQPAKVADFDVEIVRLKEASGAFDQFDAMSTRRYLLSKSAVSGDDKRWRGESRAIGRLARPQGTVIFEECLGRVTRVLTAGYQQANPI